MRVHSKMGEPGFERGLEGERDRQGVHLQQAVGEAMPRRKIFPEQEKFAKCFEKGGFYH